MNSFAGPAASTVIAATRRAEQREVGRSSRGQRFVAQCVCTSADREPPCHHAYG
jgi:hypothetical protein